MSKKLIAIIIIIVLIVIGGIYFYLKANQLPNKVQGVTTGLLSEKQQIDGNSGISKDINIPEGWQVYQNKDLKIAFAHPKSWSITETYLNERFLNVQLVGEGYSIALTNIAGEVGKKEWTHPKYYIGGYAVPRTWESFDGEKYQQILSLAVVPEFPRIIVKISTPASSKDLSDQIISSIIFLK